MIDDFSELVPKEFADALQLCRYTHTPSWHLPARTLGTSQRGS